MNIQAREVLNLPCELLKYL